MPEDEPGTFSEKIDAMGEVLRAEAAKVGREVPEIVIEPGRSMVCAAGCTLYTVGSVRDIKDARSYVSVDGGLPDNPRFALYQAEYDAVVANRADAPKDKLQTIAGRCCESGDLVARDLMFQTAKAEDILCVFATGAYNFSMASNYNRVPRAPIVLVQENGETKVVVKRETYEDLIRNDL
jgi:diaminopimelate decarboxylase